MSRNTHGPRYLDYVSVGGTEREASDGYPLPVRHADQIPASDVAPTVTGSPQALQEFGDGTNDVRYLRMTVDAGDDVTAGTRLKNGYPDTQTLIPGQVHSVHAAAAITRLDVIAIGDVASASSVPGKLVAEASAESVYRTNMQTFDWAATSDVRSVVVTISDRYGATTGAPVTTANYVMAHVVGKGHA